jgi:hypothetical protein
VGAPNLITEEKVREATALVAQGRSISLSRPLVVAPLVVVGATGTPVNPLVIW